jgi:hypothetical protein
MTILAGWMGVSIGFVLGTLWSWAMRDAHFRVPDAIAGNASRIASRMRLPADISIWIGRRRPAAARVVRRLQY